VRITWNQMVAARLRDLVRAERAAARLEEVVASGKMVVRPSDEPARAARAVRLDGVLRSLEAARQNGARARSELEAADAALQQLSSVLARAREIAVAGGSETLGATERKALAAEAEGLIGQALRLSNTELGGRYLFGGTATEKTPFSLDSTGGKTRAVYSGARTAREVPIGTATIEAGRPGPQPFATSEDGPGAIDAILGLKEALLNGGADPAGAARAAIAAIDAALDRTAEAIGANGASLSELSQIDEWVSSRAAEIERLKSAVEDADLSRAIVELRSRQATYERALEVTGIVLRTSILDFLRG
jgi:flagellar hook-associated protein 3 FlgL